MSYPWKLVWRLTFLVVFSCLVAGCGDPPPSPVPQTPHDLLRQKLRQKVSLNENKVSLDQLLARLSAECGVEFEIDQPALLDDGSVPEVLLPRLRDVSLDTALRLALRELWLTHVLVDDVIHVTTVDAAADLAVTKVYSVSRLLENHPEFTEEDLRKVIGDVFDLDHRKDLHGLADWEIEATNVIEATKPGMLVITCREFIHDEVARLLEDMAYLGDPLLEPPPSTLTRADAAIERALKQPVKFAYEKAPLSQVMRDISQQFAINIVFDRRELGDRRIVPEDKRITGDVAGITLRDFLNRILEELGVAFVHRHETLEITSQEKTLTTQLYPVGDLLDKRRGITYEGLLECIGGHPPAGGGGFLWSDPDTFDAIPGGILVKTVSYRHDLIEEFFRQLRRALDPQVVDYEPVASFPAAASLYRKLAATTSVDFEQTPVSEVLQQLKVTHDVPIEFNRGELEQAFGRIPADTLISVQLRDVSLRSVLAHVLKPLGLTAFVDDRLEVILVTHAALVTRIYRIGQLNKPSLGLPRGHLRNLILNHISPDMWKETGGQFGDMYEFADVLIVSQTTEAHEIIRQTIAALNRLLDPANTSAVALDDSPASRRLQAALGAPTSLEFTNVSLADIFAQLKQRHPGLNVVFNRKAIEEAGISVEKTKWTVRVREAPLREALDTMFGPPSPFYLGWKIADESVVITSWNDAENTHWNAAENDKYDTRLHYFDSRLLGRGTGPDLFSLLRDHVVTDKFDPEDAWPLPKGLIVSQFPRVQRRIKRFLERLRRQLSGEDDSSASPHDDLLGKLAQPARFQCKDEPLETVLRRLQTKYGIALLDDEPRFLRRTEETRPPSGNWKVTVDVRDASLAELLDEVLRSTPLRWCVYDGRVAILTIPRGEIEKVWETEVYDAGPLLAALRKLPFDYPPRDSSRRNVDERNLLVDLVAFHTVERLKFMAKYEHSASLLRDALIVTQALRGHIAVREVLNGADDLRRFIETIAAAEKENRTRLVIKGLQHPSATVRAFAALALKHFAVDSRPTVEALVGALKSSQRPVRLCALSSLSKVSSDSPLVRTVVLPSLAEQLHRGEPIVSRYAAATLGEFGIAASDELFRALGSRHAETRREAIDALAKLGEASVPLLIQALDNEDHDREHILEKLAWFGSGAKAAIPALARIASKCNDKTPADRQLFENICRTLGSIGESAVSALVKLAGPNRGDLRRHVFDALGETGTRDEKALKLLKDASGTYYLHGGSYSKEQFSAFFALDRLTPKRVEKIKDR